MNAFELKGQETIEDIKSQVSLFVHKKTAAEVVVIKNDDADKMFGISFKTLPASQNGVAHILEHAVLTGSKKYPVKDPFSYLLKTYLFTFLNAFTSRDKTTYPVSSSNEKGFENLMEVYLDTIFNPVLSENIFKQQGWHYEIPSKTSPIVYKGVVFNEMKGAFSNADELIYRYLDKHLFPENVYSKESAGVPDQIVDLTYQEFKQFYKENYHPSNSRTILYGDLDVQKYLDKVDAYFSKYELRTDFSQITLQKAFEKPLEVKEKYPFTGEEEKKKGCLGMGWVCKLAGQDRIAMEILSYVLLESRASSFRKKVLESGFCEQIIPFGYYSGYLQPIFYVGFSGVDLAVLDSLKKLVMEEFKNAIENLDKDLIDSGINKFNFLRSEADFGETKGLVYFSLMLESWFYGKNPTESLKFKATVEDLREKAKNDIDYFKKLLQKNLLTNNHHVTLQLLPDENLLSESVAFERKRLDEFKNSLSSEEIKDLVDKTHEYLKWNSTPDSKEDVAKLPQLTLSDVEKTIKKVTTECDEIKHKHTLLLNDLETNDILYLDVVYDFYSLPEEYFPYAAIYGKCLSRLGTGTLTPQELGLQIDKELGGFYYNAEAKAKWKSSEVSVTLEFSTKIHAANFENGFQVLKKLLFEPNFENLLTLEKLIIEEKARAESNLVENGNAYAVSKARSFISPVYDITEKISNIDYLLFLRNLEKRIKAGAIKKISNELLSFHSHLLRSKKVINVSCKKDYHSKVRGLIEKLCEDFTFEDINPTYKFTPSMDNKVAYVISSEVNFVAEAYPTVNTKHGGYLFAAIKELNAGYLWQKIRSEGGAYGASTQITMNDMVFSTYSYRDPNIVKTYEAFSGIGEYLANFKPQKKEFESLLVGASNRINPYLTPKEKGERALYLYLTGTSYELLQERLNTLLSCMPSDINEFGKELTKIAENQKNRVLLGNAELIKDFNKNNEYKVEILS